MIDEERISTKIAKQVFEEMLSSGKAPAEIVEAKGLIQISDPAQILPIIDKVIAENPENLEKYRAGNSRLMGFFVGQVLKATGGKANPKVVNQLVKERLG
ncbi:Aspartyl/glutamyl-tRNA(Asn/Gln) amidotransferase subunit B [compost metagenome]